MAFLAFANAFFDIKQGDQRDENQRSPSPKWPSRPHQKAACHSHEDLLIFLHFQNFGKNNDLLTIFAAELLHFEKDTAHSFQFHWRHRADHAGHSMPSPAVTQCGTACADQILVSSHLCSESIYK